MEHLVGRMLTPESSDGRIDLKGKALPPLPTMKRCTGVRLYTLAATPIDHWSVLLLSIIVPSWPPTWQQPQQQVAMCMRPRFLLALWWSVARIMSQQPSYRIVTRRWRRHTNRHHNKLKRLVVQMNSIIIRWVHCRSWSITWWWWLSWRADGSPPPYHAAGWSGCRKSICAPCYHRSFVWNDHDLQRLYLCRRRRVWLCFHFTCKHTHQ